MDLDHVHACDLRTLVEAGIIESEERDFGEVTYQFAQPQMKSTWSSHVGALGLLPKGPRNASRGAQPPR